jgi:16S rRNA C967 or C1407 C5-methylase (RsmB/RsmF family)
VTSRDSSRLAESYPLFADLVIVDAPCSGQSLVARGKPSPGCFHPATINLNANRQRRILAHAAALVAPGGHLAYITCTYAVKENEGNVSWFMRRFPDFVPCQVPRLEPFQSHCSSLPCYRLWPQSGMGAGGFAALLRNSADGEPADVDPAAMAAVWTTTSPRRLRGNP